LVQEVLQIQFLLLLNKRAAIQYFLQLLQQAAVAVELTPRVLLEVQVAVVLEHSQAAAVRVTKEVSLLLKVTQVGLALTAQEVAAVQVKRLLLEAVAMVALEALVPHHQFQVHL
jgi:hypothetical protein